MEIYKNLDLNNLYGEIWKEINGYLDYYVSNLGRVKSLKFRKEKILRQSINRRGYLKVGLCNNNVSKTKEIHRLVYENFCEELKDNECVHHIDQNKLNNETNNLQNINKFEHWHYHSNGERNPFYRKHHSEESKRKMNKLSK